MCTEPSNVKAGGHACPYKYSCIGCGHFRSDASYLPELKSYPQQLLADRERILATDVQEWVRTKAATSDEEIDQLCGLIRHVEDDLDHLSPADQQRIHEAIDVIRSARQKVSLGMPSIGFQEREQNQTLQNEIQELQAKLRDEDEELGAAREANRQLIGQLNKTEPSGGFDARRGTIQDAACQD